ncbi:MAG: biotin/lipoyl-binding protein, partial [Mesorhizobium sp.]
MQMLQTNTQFNPSTLGSSRRAFLAFVSANKWLIPALLVAVALGAWLLARWLVGPAVVVYPVVRGDLVKTVVASGHVESPYRVNIASQITGTVRDVLVIEGQSVKQGQPLVVLEPSELNAAVVAAEGAVAEAEARVRQMRELTLPAAEQAQKQAEASLVDARAAYQRAEDLFRSGFGTKQTLDEATKNFDVAQSQVRTAELQVYTSRPGGSDYVMAET